MPARSDTDTDAWLTLPEAVAAGYCSGNTLRRYIKAGRFPSAHKRGGTWHIHLNDLDALDPRPSFADVKARISRALLNSPSLSPVQRNELVTLVRSGGVA